MIKLFHQLFLFLWIGALFELPALLRQRFSAAYRLYRAIQLPCMILAIGCGIILLIMNPAKLKIGFFHMKLTAAIGLIACDLWMGRQAFLSHKKGKFRSNRYYFFMQILIVILLFIALAGVYLQK